MSNRKRPRNPLPTAVHAPVFEKEVEKKVPAVIHWGNVNGVDRTDSETIGEAIIYTDGTQDISIRGDISDDAKKLMGNFDHAMHYSLDPKSN